MSTIFCLASSVTVRPIRVAWMVGRRTSVCQSRDLMTTGSKVVSMAPFFHENWGSNVESHGYPRITSSIPRSVIRNRIFSSRFPVLTNKSTYLVSCPAQLVDPSIFQIFIDRFSFCVPTWSLLTNFGCMKLSVTPESTRILLLAMAYRVRNETGIFIDRYLVIYTLLHRKVRIQAVGLRLPKNPFLS